MREGNRIRLKVSGTDLVVIIFSSKLRYFVNNILVPGVRLKDNVSLRVNQPMA